MHQDGGRVQGRTLPCDKVDCGEDIPHQKRQAIKSAILLRKPDVVIRFHLQKMTRNVSSCLRAICVFTKLHIPMADGEYLPQFLDQSYEIKVKIYCDVQMSCSDVNKIELCHMPDRCAAHILPRWSTRAGPTPVGLDCGTGKLLYRWMVKQASCIEMQRSFLTEPLAFYCMRLTY